MLRAADSFRDIRIGELELGRLERLRGQLIDKHGEATTKAATENPGSAPFCTARIGVDPVGGVAETETRHRATP